MPVIEPLDGAPEITPAPQSRGLSRRLMTAGLMVASLASVGVAIWAGYVSGVRDREVVGAVPLLRAESGEIKRRPNSPGGIDPPHQDKLIYDRVAPGQSGDTVERVRPAPEEPITPQPEETSAAASEAETSKPETSEIAVGTKPADDSADNGANGTSNSALTSRSSAGAVAPEISPATQESEADAQAADAKETATTPPTGTAESEENTAADIAATAPAAGKPAANVETAAKPPPPPATTPPAGSWRVQLASFRTEERAGVAWQKFKTAHGDALAPLDNYIERADLGERGIYYRVQAGPFADKQTAAKFCALLRARKLSCIVVKG